MATKVISVQDVINAMRLNGYKKARYTYIRDNTAFRKIVAACAIGQAALNLGVLPVDVEYLLNLKVNGSDLKAKYFVVGANDKSGNSPTVIADMLEKHLTPEQLRRSYEVVDVSPTYVQRYSNYQGVKEV